MLIRSNMIVLYQQIYSSMHTCEAFATPILTDVLDGVIMVDNDGPAGCSGIPCFKANNVYIYYMY